MLGNITCNTMVSNQTSLGTICSNASILPTNVSQVTGNVENLPVTGIARYLCYVFYGLVFLFGASGNVLVFYVLGHRKKERAGGDLFILSLACADFLASIVVPLVMLNDLISVSWLYGEAMCHALPAISPATLSASAWSLVLISLDRYRIVAKPMAPRPRGLILYGGLFFIWILSLSITVPYALRLQLVGSICMDYNSKIIKLNDYVVFIGFWVLVIWVIPNIIIIIVYCFTTAALKKSTLKHANNRAMEQRNKQNSKIVRMFVIIVILFFILTMPYALFYFVASYQIAYDPSIDGKLLVTWNYILFIPASANGCVNPLVYAKMHRGINGYLRATTRRILSCFPSLFGRRHSNADVPPSSTSTWSVSTSRTDQTMV